jgi:hypothetical protein
MHWTCMSKSQQCQQSTNLYYWSADKSYIYPPKVPLSIKGKDDSNWSQHSLWQQVLLQAVFLKLNDTDVTSRLLLN